MLYKMNFHMQMAAKSKIETANMHDDHRNALLTYNKTLRLYTTITGILH